MFSHALFCETSSACMQHQSEENMHLLNQLVYLKRALAICKTRQFIFLQLRVIEIFNLFLFRILLRNLYDASYSGPLKKMFDA